MLKRVNELKEQRENERQEFVKEKLEKRFKDNTDELRKVDADFKELKTVYERNIQIMEKQRELEDKYYGL